jgi:alpha-1,6-mannosyltransferase
MGARVNPHLLDTTMFFSPTSGGVRRYLLAKHDWLGRRASVTHTLLVPGAASGGTVGDIVEFSSPLIPFGAGYRFPWRLDALRHVLAGLQPDLIEAADPYQMGWQAARVAATLGIPAVAFCHSDLIALVRGRLGRSAGELCVRYLRSLYSQFDLVLAPSRMVAGRLADAGIDRVVVQPLGVDAEIFRPERASRSLRASLGLSPRTRLLVFAGRLAPEKNLGDLHAMVDLLGDPYHLLIVGGPVARRPSPRVTVLPYQREPTRLAAWLAGADVVVHAGRSETFGLVALEGMACARPVVVYNAGALPEIVDEGVGAVASDLVPRGLAAAVASVFDRDPLALGAEGRHRVIEQYTWDRALGHALGLYAGLLRRATLLHEPVPDLAW